MNDMLISVIMPAYNAGRTIEESVISVIAQTHASWELIIIDDCSTDETCRIARKLSLKDSRIRILQNERNLGVSATRNKGVSAASGEWIAFIDSDDSWKVDKLEKQLKVINNRADADLLYTGSSFVSSHGEQIKYQLSVPDEISYRELLKQNLISCSSVMLRKTLAECYSMAHDDMHEDYAVWLQLLRDGYRAYGVNEPLLIYRLSEKSKSGNKWKAALMTYKVYRFTGLEIWEAFYYFIWYALKNLKKYYLIKSNYSRPFIGK